MAKNGLPALGRDKIKEEKGKKKIRLALQGEATSTG